jgi:hypothetical protein
LGNPVKINQNLIGLISYGQGNPVKINQNREIL